VHLDKQKRIYFYALGRKMIPNYNESGVLPPFLPGSSPIQEAATAPYVVELEDFIIHYATSEKRKEILNGFLQYRLLLKENGIINGFQWIDGSFLENVESIRNRSPSDIDIITFASRPENYSEMAEWEKYVLGRETIFNPQKTKELYFCDAYYIDLNLPPHTIVRNTAYWFGLFSHQRETYLWKGMLQLSLDEDEKELFVLLEKELANDQ
jgi:hypothetical protein